MAAAVIGWLRRLFSPSTATLRRHLAEAELELAEAQYQIDVWGFSDSPKRRHAKEQVAKRAAIRLEKVRTQLGWQKLEDLTGGPD